MLNKNKLLYVFFALFFVEALAQNWVEVAGSDGAQPLFVDLDSIKQEHSVPEIRQFTGLFNVTIDTDNGGHTEGSVLAQFSLKCQHKAIRTDSTRLYDQLDGKGELLEEMISKDAVFSPLNDAVRAKDLLTRICN